MPTHEQLRTRLASFGDLRSIVKTMKALSAASIRQYEQASLALEDYDRTVGLGLRAVLAEMGPVREPAKQAPPGPTILVVLGSNHGLCGRLNHEVVDLALTHLGEPAASGHAPRVISVGARTTPLLSQAGFDPDVTLDAPASAARINAVVQDILLAADNWLGASDLRTMAVVYARRTDAAFYRPLFRQLLPVPPAGADAAKAGWPGKARPMFSMPTETLLHSLQQQQLFVAMFRACAESQASEHSSRLLAMTAAQRNIESRIVHVTFDARRKRQDAITAELLDVVAGYEGLSVG